MQPHVLYSEGKVLARYLIGSQAPDDIVLRYCSAVDTLLPADTQNAGTQFITRSPFLVPYLDAALAIVSRHAEVRSKILIMMAILEASPEFVKHFLPRPHSRTWSVFYLILIGMRAMWYTLVGLCIYPLVRRKLSQ